MKIPKRLSESVNQKRTDKDQYKLSPISALSVIGVWQYERVRMSRTPFLFSIKLLGSLIPI
jgi:hypothetical protein